MRVSVSSNTAKSTTAAVVSGWFWEKSEVQKMAENIAQGSGRYVSVRVKKLNFGLKVKVTIKGKFK
ncbi:hypothetical protein V5L74_001833 [Enterobacter hormaechei]